jgi:hypothetical protein
MIFNENPLIEKSTDLKIPELILEELICGILEGAADLISIKLKCMQLNNDKEVK